MTNFSYFIPWIQAFLRSTGTMANYEKTWCQMFANCWIAHPAWLWNKREKLNTLEQQLFLQLQKWDRSEVQGGQTSRSSSYQPFLLYSEIFFFTKNNFRAVTLKVMHRLENHQGINTSHFIWRCNTWTLCRRDTWNLEVTWLVVIFGEGTSQ